MDQNLLLNRIKFNKPIGKKLVFFSSLKARSSSFKLSGTIGVLLHLGLPHHHRFQHTGRQGQIQLPSPGRFIPISNFQIFHIIFHQILNDNFEREGILSFYSAYAIPLDISGQCGSQVSFSICSLCHVHCALISVTHCLHCKKWRRLFQNSRIPAHSVQ